MSFKLPGQFLRFKIALLSLSLLLFTVNSNAQIVSGEVFLQGDFVEVGISACGSFGTENSPPAGYHPTENGMGFVADAGMDGWNTGTPIYCGDYFLPGSPIEGFGLQIGADVYLNSNNGPMCGNFEIP